MKIGDEGVRMSVSFPELFMSCADVSQRKMLAKGADDKLKVFLPEFFKENKEFQSGHIGKLRSNNRIGFFEKPFKPETRFNLKNQLQISFDTKRGSEKKY